MARPRTISDETLLTGAAAVVARRGPAAVTLADIGAEVGLSPATLLQRFGSKRGLLLALARQAAADLPRTIRRAAQAAHPTEALIEVLAELAGGVRTPEEFANHLAFLLLDLTDPDFGRITADYAAAVEAAILEVLQASQTAGERTETASTGLPRAVHAAYNGALITWGMHSPNPASPAEAVRAQLCYVLSPVT